MPRSRRTDPTDALVDVSAHVSRWIERLLAAHEPRLTLAQFQALRAVAAEPITAADLARRTGVSGAAVSQLVGALEQAGWIERSREPSDRRRNTLALTKTGATVLTSATNVVNAQLGSLLSDLPRPEADSLARLLDKVERALGGAHPPRRPPPPPRPRPRRP
jgi:DNA-binding MarR family transcriptional regulator